MWIHLYTEKNYGRSNNTTTNKTQDTLKQHRYLVQLYDISNSYTLQLVNNNSIAATTIYSAARAFWPNSCAIIAVTVKQRQLAIA